MLIAIKSVKISENEYILESLDLEGYNDFETHILNISNLFLIKSDIEIEDSLIFIESEIYKNIGYKKLLKYFGIKNIELNRLSFSDKVKIIQNPIIIPYVYKQVEEYDFTEISPIFKKHIENYISEYQYLMFIVNRLCYHSYFDYTNMIDYNNKIQISKKEKSIYFNVIKSNIFKICDLIWTNPYALIKYGIEINDINKILIDIERFIALNGVSQISLELLYLNHQAFMWKAYDEFRIKNNCLIPSKVRFLDELFKLCEKEEYDFDYCLSILNTFEEKSGNLILKSELNQSSEIISILSQIYDKEINNDICIDDEEIQINIEHHNVLLIDNKELVVKSNNCLIINDSQEINTNQFYEIIKNISDKKIILAGNDISGNRNNIMSELKCFFPCIKNNNDENEILTAMQNISELKYRREFIEIIKGRKKLENIKIKYINDVGITNEYGYTVLPEHKQINFCNNLNFMILKDILDLDLTPKTYISRDSLEISNKLYEYFSDNRCIYALNMAKQSKNVNLSSCNRINHFIMMNILGFYLYDKEHYINTDLDEIHNKIKHKKINNDFFLLKNNFDNNKYYEYNKIICKDDNYTLFYMEGMPYISLTDNLKNYGIVKNNIYYIQKIEKTIFYINEIPIPIKYLENNFDYGFSKLINYPEQHKELYLIIAGSLFEKNTDYTTAENNHKMKINLSSLYNLIKKNKNSKINIYISRQYVSILEELDLIDNDSSFQYIGLN